LSEGYLIKEYYGGMEVKIPADLYYSPSHEWVRVEGDQAWIGISDYAQHELGDIVFVEMPEPDDELEAGGQLGVIESVKAASTIYSPVGGTVVAINEELEDAPQLINEDPYANYIVVVAMNNPGDVDSLLSAAAYEELCQKEQGGE
jgi:glycine cleavage system H protein